MLMPQIDIFKKDFQSLKTRVGPFIANRYTALCKSLEPHLVCVFKKIYFYCKETVYFII